MFALLAVCLLGHGPSLATLHAIASADRRANVPPAEWEYTRYASLHGVPEGKVGEFANIAFRLAANGVSLKGDFHYPKLIAGGRLLRINTRALGWDKYSREAELAKMEALGVKLNFKSDRDKHLYLDIWEFMGYFEPYFVANGAYGNPKVRGWLDPAIVELEKREAKTEKLVMSASWLLPRLSLERDQGGFYSQILLNPPNEADLEKKLGVNAKLADLDPRGKHGAAVIRSQSVAHNPREIQLLTPSTGYDQFYYWRTLDFANVEDAKKDIVETPAGKAKHDAREILYSLWNGLMGGYLSNGQGVQQAFAPQNIAEDRRETGEAYYCPTKTVVNMIKCLDCHGESSGFIAFDDNVIKLIAPPRLDTGYVVVDYDPKRAAQESDRILEFYRKGLREKAALHRTSYEARVQELTGKDVLAATRTLLKHYDAYTPAFVSRLVTPEQSYREIALPEEGARALYRASGEPTLNRLAAGQPVPRARWEATLCAPLRADTYRWDVVPVPVPLKAK